MALCGPFSSRLIVCGIVDELLPEIQLQTHMEQLLVRDEAHSEQRHLQATPEAKFSLQKYKRKCGSVSLSVGNFQMCAQSHHLSQLSALIH